jgi:hypothetical protein
MDDTQAHKIISALADGCDPTTGEKVEASILQHGDVIRALHIAVRALETSARSKPRSSRARMPANAGKPWTEQEDRELLEKFDAGQTVAQLAQAHDRTAAGIHARLVRHGRLQGDGPQWRGRAANTVASATGGESSEA